MLSLQSTLYNPLYTFSVPSVHLSLLLTYKIGMPYMQQIGYKAHFNLFTYTYKIGMPYMQQIGYKTQFNLFTYT